MGATASLQIELFDNTGLEQPFSDRSPVPLSGQTEAFDSPAPRKPHPVDESLESALDKMSRAREEEQRKEAEDAGRLEQEDRNERRELEGILNERNREIEEEQREAQKEAIQARIKADKDEKTRSEELNASQQAANGSLMDSTRDIVRIFGGREMSAFFAVATTFFNAIRGAQALAAKAAGAASEAVTEAAGGAAGAASEAVTEAAGGAAGGVVAEAASEAAEGVASEAAKSASDLTGDAAGRLATEAASEAAEGLASEAAKGVASEAAEGLAGEAAKGLAGEAAEGVAGEAAKGGKGVLAASKALIGLAPPVAIAAASVAALAGSAAIGAFAFKRFSSTMEQEVKKLEEVSISVAVAGALTEIEETFRELERGQKIGPELAEFERTRSELDTAMYKVQTQLYSLALKFINEYGPIFKLISKTLLSIAGFLEKYSPWILGAASWWGKAGAGKWAQVVDAILLMAKLMEDSADEERMEDPITKAFQSLAFFDDTPEGRKDAKKVELGI